MIRDINGQNKVKVNKFGGILNVLFLAVFQKRFIRIDTNNIIKKSVEGKNEQSDHLYAQ